MISVKEAIIVEGRYDKITLSQLVDTPIIETGGFRVFKDKEKQNLIRTIAKKRGILILTDSDSAGFVIRNFLRGAIPDGEIKHAYIPQLSGKEKRKEHSSKEGFLGVEGLSQELLADAIRRSGAEIIGEDRAEVKPEITKSDLYDLGLTGTENSAEKRQRLLKSLNMPTYLTTNAMLSALNCLYSLKELKELLNNSDT